MSPSIAQILLGVSRALPPRISAPLYYRLFSRLNWGNGPFEGAPLTYAPGFKMNLMSTDVCHGSIAFTGCYELPLTHRLCEIARTEGGTLIDAGANYGYYSLLWTAANAANRVIAFEASPRNYPALVANLELNGVADRVTAINQAVGDKIGTVSFKMSDSNQSGWDKITTDATESQWTIPMTTIDRNVGEAQITAIKIDCEGYDFHVIRGAKDLIAKRQVRHIFFEENPGCAEKFGIGSGDIRDHLISCGYHVASLGGPAEFEASLKV